MKINKLDRNTIKVNQYSRNKLNKKENSFLTIENNYAKAPSNPKYYQIANNISFCSNVHFLAIPIGHKNKIEGIILQIPTQDNDRITLEFEENEAQLFLNQFGQIDNNIVKAYVEIYTKYYSIQKAKYEKEKEFLLKVLNDNSPNKFISLNPFEERKHAFEESFKADNDDYIENYLLNIKDKNERKSLAAQCLTNCEENFAKSSHTCAAEAMFIIALSKTPQGLDLSNYEIKNEIAVIIANFSKRVDLNCFDLIIENSQDKNGNFDIDFCLKLSRIILHLFNDIDPREQIENVASTLRYIQEKDSKNYIQATFALTSFIQDGAMDFSADSEDIQTFYNCFNPISEKFEIEAQKILQNFYEILGSWYEENMPSEEEIGWDNYQKLYKTITNKIINDYFKEARDSQSGKIKENFATPGEYLSNYTL
ncbi:MAG: hypothetical protein IJB79_05835 [Candidatus Gastranaerophilales bacterium]|nr:hypothetical protein [Candidatus Gastranaerophilales bacterium]